MIILSPYRITYTAGTEPPRQLLMRHAILLSLTRDWSRTQQTDQAIGSPWSVAADRGNASVTLSWRVALAWPTLGQAQRGIHMLETWANDRPEGSLLYETAFNAELPMVAERWDAVLQRCQAEPLDSSIHYGEIMRDAMRCTAWAVMSYTYILTNRATLI